MSIWSRLRESPLGVSLGGSLGPLWRAVTGRPAEGDEAEGGVAFTMAVIALSAKMAKADGHVSAREVEAFNRLFHVPEDERANVGRFFNLARQSVAGFESYARDVAKLFRGRPGVLEDVLDGLFTIALADGDFRAAEGDYLARVAEIFGFSEGEFQRIAASHLEDDPYRVLGVSPDCGDDELKHTYRRLVAENHPDRLIARGVPAEFVAMANDKLAAINAAYDRALARRGALARSTDS